MEENHGRESSTNRIQGEGEDGGLSRGESPTSWRHATPIAVSASNSSWLSANRRLRFNLRTLGGESLAIPAAGEKEEKKNGIGDGDGRSASQPDQEGNSTPRLRTGSSSSSADSDKTITPSYYQRKNPHSTLRPSKNAIILFALLVSIALNSMLSGILFTRVRTWNAYLSANGLERANAVADARSNAQTQWWTVSPSGWVCEMQISEEGENGENGEREGGDGYGDGIWHDNPQPDHFEFVNRDKHKRDKGVFLSQAPRARIVCGYENRWNLVARMAVALKGWAFGLAKDLASYDLARGYKLG